MIIFYYLVWIVFRVIGYICGIDYRGANNIPSQGAFIFASNHQDNLDPIFLGAWCRRKLHFFAKRELWNNKFIGWFISHMGAFPVNRQAMDKSVINEIKRVFKLNKGLVFFPEGTRGNGEKLLPAKPGIGLIIKLSRANVPIVPVYMGGTNNLKACFWRRRKLTFIIGQPLSADEIASYLTNKEGYQKLADRVMLEIQKLKDSGGY